MTIDIDATRQRPLTDEPGNNTFVVWYDPNREPYAVYFRSDANAWDDQRWFNADQHHSGGTEPSSWNELSDELYGNDGPHLLVPGAKVDELTAELARVNAAFKDAVAELAERYAERDAALNRAHRAETDAAQIALAKDGIAAERDAMRPVVEAAKEWRDSDDLQLFGVDEAGEALVAAVDALPKAATV